MNAFFDTGAPVHSARYSITAVRWREDEIDALMLGLRDTETQAWVIRPAPAPLLEVVDRVLDGDEVTALFEQPGGRLVAGPPLRVCMLDSGDETLEAVHAPAPGRDIGDLPRF